MLTAPITPKDVTRRGNAVCRSNGLIVTVEPCSRALSVPGQPRPFEVCLYKDQGALSHLRKRDIYRTKADAVAAVNALPNLEELGW